jgi:hypothetical protein
MLFFILYTFKIKNIYITKMKGLSKVNKYHKLLRDTIIET